MINKFNIKYNNNPLDVTDGEPDHVYHYPNDHAATLSLSE